MCKHFIGTMRLHHLGSILSVLLRMTVFSTPVLGPLSANAADVLINNAESSATASASQDQSPPKGDESPSSSAQSTIRSETKKHNVRASETESPLEEIVVTGTYIRGVSPTSPVITITSVDIENSGASTDGASALYGSGAAGGFVHVVLEKERSDAGEYGGDIWPRTERRRWQGADLVATREDRRADDGGGLFVRSAWEISRPARHAMIERGGELD